MMETFIREARLVTLSFFVDDLPLKQHANQLIEQKVAETIAQFRPHTSIHEVQANVVDKFVETGVRYFRRYALSNLAFLMETESQSKYNYLTEELAVIDEVIAEIRENLKIGQSSLTELGEYLMIHIRLQNVKDSIEREMISALDRPDFKEKILPAAARLFYEDNRKRKQERAKLLGTQL